MSDDDDETYLPNDVDMSSDSSEEISEPLKKKRGMQTSLSKDICVSSERNEQNYEPPKKKNTGK